MYVMTSDYDKGHEVPLGGEENCQHLRGAQLSSRLGLGAGGGLEMEGSSVQWPGMFTRHTWVITLW